MMRKLYTLTIVGLLFASLSASAQFVGPGRHNIAIGAAANQTLIDLIDGQNDTENASMLPVFYLNFDYNITKRFSLGFGADFQTNTISGKNADYTYTFNTFAGGLRPLYHFVAKEGFDFYAGAEAGFALSDATLDDNSGLNLTIDPDDNKSEVMANLIIGINKYIGRFVGINLEAAVGTSELYSLGLGFSFRF